MTASPGRRHTARGRYLARDLPPCRHEQPDPGCWCDACVNYWAAYDRTHSPSTSLACVRAAS